MPERMRFPVTPAQVEAARSRLAQAGYPLSGDSGAIAKDGYLIGYALTDGVLILEVLVKPRFVPMLAVKAKIRSMLAMECLAETA
ncbi:MAG TPA: hypothetical protein PLZ95_20790 [Bryobacteraceae bacterium]|nr:hypothetical protein [Bryobacteraceae bacterium]